MRTLIVAKLILTTLFAIGCGQSDTQVEVTTEFDPMTAFGTTAGNVFFYYEDVEAATTFYREVMGFHVAADYGFAKIMQVAPQSFITLVDHTKGMHSADEPKRQRLHW